MAEKSNEGKEKSFEEALAELERIVAELESGEKPLDESLALYEKGVAEFKRCWSILEKAEKRIRMLVQGPGGEPTLQEGKLPENSKPPSNRRGPAKPPVSAEPGPTGENSGH